MSDLYVVAIEGLTDLASLENLPKDVSRIASMAINATARRGYAEIGRQIRREINFPASYLTGKEGRLRISKFAEPEKLEAEITARRRPTSLARFAVGTLKVGGTRRAPGVRVEIKPGQAVRLPKAFAIRLRAGIDTDTKSNLGVAIRLPAGKRPRGSREGAKELGRGSGVWLLYGPSVQQAFINKQGSGSAKNASPEIAAFLEREFLRLKDLEL